MPISSFVAREECGFDMVDVLFCVVVIGETSELSI
jgi:hypothetical protein